MSNRHPWFSCPLAGIGYALSVSGLFEGFPWGLFAWIALLPLHLTLNGTTTGQAFMRGWLTGCVAFVGTMYWVVTAIHRYGNVPLTASIAVMLLLAVYLGLYIGLYAWGFRWLEQRWTPMAWLLAPCLWVSLEYVRTCALSGIPWGLLGYSQVQWLPIIQIASITGVYGVSFLIVLVNVAVFLPLCRAMAQQPRHAASLHTWGPLASTTMIVFVTWFYGVHQLTLPVTAPLNVGIVQANIDQAQKWDRAYRAETLARYDRLTQAIGPDADLILWPEAATPFVFEQESSDQSHVVDIVKHARTPLVFGSLALRHRDDGTLSPLNSAYVLNRSGVVTGRYDKQHLVPFGEYIPLKPVFFFLNKLVAGISDFQPGQHPVLLAIPDGQTQQQTRFGVAICYEVIFPDLVRRLAAKGANFLITITNDAWFGNTVAPYQHFSMVVFRAVENRLSFARAANTGISGLIDPTGRILTATPVFTERVVTGTIPLGTPSTLYTRFGDVFARACVILIALAMVLSRFCPRAAGAICRWPTRRKGDQNA